MTNQEIVDDWFARHLEAQGVLALTGMRGTGKSKALERFALWHRGHCRSGEDVLLIHCESRLLRHIRTGEELWTYVCSRTTSGPLHLFIDEASSFRDIGHFFELVFSSGRCTTVCIACSNSRVLADVPDGVMVHECRLLPDGTHMRSAIQLDRLWDALFLRDVLNGLHLVDVQAIEHVAEWVIDHMGESASLRRIGMDLASMGCRLSHNTVGSYLDSLQSSYLVERVPCWDVFEQVESKTDYSFFCMDLELRRYRRGPTPELNMTNLVRALAYIDLRRAHGRVCSVKNGPEGADFVTSPGKGPVFWHAGPNGATPML